LISVFASIYQTSSSVEALAGAVMALADNPDRMRELQRAGQEHVRDVLSWEHQSPRLVEVYERLFPEIA
jgi:glycosyltransferase involved in cell wall biosynthesis